MRTISFKKILIVFAIIFLLSRSRKILEFLDNFHFDEDFFDILTLEPLRQSPPEARYMVTLALFALIFITLFKLLYRGK